MKFRPGTGLVLESGVKVCSEPTLSLSLAGDLVDGFGCTVAAVSDFDSPLGRLLLPMEREEIGRSMARRWMRWAGYQMPLLALTVRQPFADCIVFGPKRHENRSQSGPRDPCWMAIAAGMQLYDIKEPKESGMRRAAPVVDDRANGPGDIGGSGYARPRPLQEELRDLWPECPVIEEMTRGAIIGLAHYAGTWPWSVRRHGGNPWACGPSVWEFDQVIPLGSPLAHKGAQGLHRVEEALTPWLYEAARAHSVVLA